MRKSPLANGITWRLLAAQMVQCSSSSVRSGLRHFTSHNGIKHIAGLSGTNALNIIAGPKAPLHPRLGRTTVLRRVMSVHTLPHRWGKV